MEEILIQLRNASRSLPQGAMVECPHDEAQRIIATAKEIFIEGSPSTWWLSLKRPFQVFEFAEGDGYKHLGNLLPPAEQRCWLIAETDEDALPVFDLQISYLSPILAECGFFEYYLVGKKLDWLVIENDHNQLIFSDRGRHGTSDLKGEK
jgi:hypothetical protein